MNPLSHSIYKKITPNKFICWLTSVTISTIAAVSVSFPVQAAEEIRFVFDSVYLFIPVSSLETFAREGKIDEELERFFVLTGTTEKGKAAFQKALLNPVSIDPNLLSRLLNTDEVARLLKYFGRVINVEGGKNGENLIREALVNASLNDRGLNLIEILNQFPSNVEINLKKAVKLGKEVKLIVRATYAFVAEVKKLATIEIENTNAVDFSQLPDLRQPGKLGFSQQTWNLVDPQRQRMFYVEVYQPQKWRQGKIPVVVISHGLASRPENFAKRAKHLASYGYVVAIPQHPGSDFQQINNFQKGNSDQIFQLDEFIDRPLDISYTLDELERRNDNEFQGRLDLDNVGVFGHSFGGYAALAVAGATPDFDNLESRCAVDIGQLNTALLMQCRALKLERKAYNFRDERVKAVFAINPVNASIFGPNGLDDISIPVFVGAGSYDPATPFAFEQAVSYPRLTTENKYLQLQEGQAHVDFSHLDAGITDMLQMKARLILPKPKLLDDYTHSMMLAFFETYVANDPQFRTYLQSSYVRYLSQGEDFKSYLITNTSADLLRESIEQYIQDNNINVNPATEQE